MYRSLPVLLAVLFTVGPACSHDVDVPPGDGAAAAPSDPACPAELAGPLRAWGRGGFSGTIVVIDAGEPICEVAVGLADQDVGRPNTVDTTFSIGSVSKAFTAAAVLDLIADGDVGLDDRAGDHVAGLAGAAADATIEHLLLHTSGLTGSHGQDHEPLDHDDAVAALGRLERAFAPGSDFLYSNAGYSLLALVVEAVAGEPYRDHVADAVLTVDDERLGGFWDGEPAAPVPRAVGYDEDAQPSPVDGSFDGPHWALSGNGDLAMTAPELARWTHALFTGEVIDPEVVALLEETAFVQGDGAAEVPGWVRLDAGELGEPAYAMAGGGGDIGHVAVTAWLPESERVVTVMSNTADVTAEDLLVEVAPALVAGDPLPTPDLPAAADPEALAAAEGIYELDNGSGTLVVRVSDDGLTITADGPDAVAVLFPPADDADTDARRTHEGQVVDLLAGATAAGRVELESLEDGFGPVTDVAVLGTIPADRELRTYVTVTADDDDPVLIWYALDDAGGIAAVEITDDLPTLEAVAAGAGRYQPTEGPEVTVAVTNDGLTISGPDGRPVTATRV